MENNYYIKDKRWSYEFEVAWPNEVFVEKKHNEWKIHTMNQSS